MRILHVIATLNPDAGGPPMIAARLAAAQAGLGHDVHIITHTEPAGGVGACVALRGVPNLGKVKITELGPASAWERWSGGPLRPKLREAVAAAGAVHLHGVWESILRMAAKEARKSGTPYFILLNGMLHPWSLRQKATKKKIALALGYRRMLNGAAALHLGNQSEQRLIVPLGLKTRGVLIPNGVFLDELRPLPAPGRFHAAHPELKGEPFVLFLSRLHYKKGLDILAEAFAIAAKAHRQLQLVVAGPDDGARGPFEKQIELLGLGSRVHVVGPVYGRDKLAAFVDAACFCLPSHQEGFSLALTEALACGAPAVISQGCNFPEVARARAGEVLPLDPQAFGDAMVRIASYPAVRQNMSEAGQRLIESRYTWPRIAKQTIAAYEHFSATPAGL